MTELLPCPFCGCTAIYETRTHYYYGDETAAIFCNGCKSVVVLEQNEDEGVNEKTRKQAREAWNTRAERMCYNLNEPGFNYFHCSMCGEKSYCSDQRFTWCPTCGARVVNE